MVKRRSLGGKVFVSGMIPPPSPLLDPRGGLVPLTFRELAIVQLARYGFTIEHICQRWGAPLGTVKEWRTEIFHKLNAQSIVEAVIICYRAGWIR